MTVGFHINFNKLSDAVDLLWGDKVSMKRALLTSLIALNIFYLVGEQFGEKLNQVAPSIYSWSLPGPLDRICKLYAKKLVKDPDSFIQNREGDFFGDLFNVRVRLNPSSDDLRLKFFKMCMLDPLISTVVVGPLLEEVAFRLPSNQISSQVLKKVSILAFSILFASSHETGSRVNLLNPGRKTALVAMGLFLSHLAHKRDVKTAFATHALYNLTSWLEKFYKL